MSTAFLLEGIELGAPQLLAPGCAVYPVMASPRQRRTITLTEALKEKKVSFHECNESGIVGALQVKVATEQPVLVLEGELLIGGKQNRTVNLTLLLPPGEHRIGVSCVEQGRWSRRWRFAPFPPITRTPQPASEFDSYDYMLDSTIREYKLRWLKLRAEGAIQGAVWRGVGNVLRRSNAQNITSDFSEHYRRNRRAIEEYINKVEPQPNQIGIAIALYGKPYALEYVDSPDTWKNVHRRVLGSYASTLIGSAEYLHDQGQPTVEEMRAAFLDNQVVVEPRPAPAGIGTHILLRDSRKNGVHYRSPLAGFALQADECIYHAVLMRSN